MRTTLASSIVLVLALVATWWLTMGFRAYTSEQGRRLYVAAHQPLVPATRLVDANGRTHGLRDWVRGSDRAWILTFFYSRCESLCSALGAQYQRIQADLREHGLADRVALLSISFDPEHDDVPALAAYARRMDTNPEIWRVATVVDRADLTALLDFFGVDVIPDNLGGFMHNVALLWVDEKGHLTRIVDVSELWSDPILSRFLAAMQA